MPPRNLEFKPQTEIRHDGTLTLAIGQSRMETSWKNREMSWSDLLGRLSRTTRTAESQAEYLKLPKLAQDNIKDVGGFVGGTLKGGRRKALNVVWRQVITLDADWPEADLWRPEYPNAIALYSTHKHSSAKPRLRLLFPLTRPVSPDEYQAISRRLAADLGIDQFDDTTYQPHRLMYWPSTSQDAEFLFDHVDAPWLDPESLLSRYADWRDPAQWPESSRAGRVRQKLADRQGDPLSKTGALGAFCRTYTIEAAVERFLSDVYEPTGDGRYTYLAGSTAGGLVLYDEGRFAYSHHGTDPIGGRLVNAFDLVRIHKFKELDDEAPAGTSPGRLPSFIRMQEFAVEDEAVRLTLVGEKREEAQRDFGVVEDEDWGKRLKLNKQGVILSNPYNLKLIMQHDDGLKDAFTLDDFAHRALVTRDLPWRDMDRAKYWRDEDDSGLRNYLDTAYAVKGAGIVTDALNEILINRSFHPVRNYLEGLVWDGTPRLDRFFIDYLGARDTAFIRAVTRKAIVAGVARVMEPGCKFDYVLTLVGPQGCGKSTTISKLGKHWFSDSLSSVHGKDAYEQLQGMWIIEMGELWAARKSEVEALKLFITKQTDNFRVAYGRHTTVFPRQCVIFGTTNDREFLRDKTGNRRFWPVEVNVGVPKKSFRELDGATIDQVWAEARMYWLLGEELYLSAEREQEAQGLQEMHTEDSAKTGLVREYLDTLLPENWEELDLSARRRFIHGTEFGDSEPGTVQRRRVCAAEIWAELFENEIKNFKTIEAREIADIMRQIEGWQPYSDNRGRLRFGAGYGIQRAFIREEEVL